MQEIILSNITFYAASGFVILSLISILVFKKIREAKIVKHESATVAMIDQMSMRRAAINTVYIEKEFFKTIQSLVYSYYAQDLQAIPTNDITQGLYTKWYERLKREYELGVKRQIYNFVLDKAKVVKQDNSSMYAVTKIEVDAEFTIDFLYSHVTMEHRMIKNFKQKFIFLNTNNSWIIEEVFPEEIIKEEEYPIETNQP